MRLYSLMLGGIALVVLAMFLIYVIRGPVDPLIAVALFISFLSCLIPTIYLLKPYESKEEFLRRKAEQARERESTDEPGDQGS
ncbi:hypothetical protein BH24ACT22_BH24ACT22_10630 [soil metagenome]